MSKVLLYLFLLAVLVNSKIAAQVDSLDLVKASEYFKEARELSDIDNGNLWGIKLYGPILFVNPETHFIIANGQDSTGNLKKTGDVYCGQFPNDMNIANSTINWRGIKWTMLSWPLPKDPFQRKILLMHELFHRIQDNLKLPLYNSASNHLDKKDGRILFRMEWKELIAALESKGEEKTTHVKNAMLLNKYRKEMFAGADTLESQLELNEGIAEYTGFRLSGEPEDSVINFWAKRIRLGEKIPTFVRSFAYISGPMYCYLLDESGKKWRERIDTVKSLTNLLTESYSIKFKENIKEEAKSYLLANRDTSIMDFEHIREKKITGQTMYLREKFFHSAVIVLRLENMSVQFDPRNLIPVDTIGTVYPNIRITDNWGVLTVNNQAFLASDWKSVIIALPDKFTYTEGSGTLKNDDWTLEIKKGWKLAPITRKDSYTVVKEEKE